MTPEASGPQSATLDTLATGAVRASVGARELIVATGADRVRFLHGIVTGNVAGTPVGGGCRSALLTPKGHVVADMRIFLRQDEIWIVVAPGVAATLAPALARYAIMDDFAAAPRPASAFASIGLLGPAASERLAAAGIDAGDLGARPELSHADVDVPDVGRLWVVRAHELGADGFWLAGEPAAVAAADARLAAAGVGCLRRRARRGGAHRRASSPRKGRRSPPTTSRWRSASTARSTTRRAVIWARSRSCASATAATSTGAWSGWTSTTRATPRPQDAIESDVKPKAGRVTSAGATAGRARRGSRVAARERPRWGDGTGQAWRRPHPGARAPCGLRTGSEPGDPASLRASLTVRE